jgi:orotate phosphoribosyltransferase
MNGSELFERHRTRLLELLKILAYEEREVVLASGRKSNFYID